jgi:hypothetical protein
MASLSHRAAGSRTLRACVTATLVLLVAGCQTQATAGGLALGDRRCTDADMADPNARAACDRFMAFGRSTLESAEPAHAPVVAVEVYRDPVHHVFGGFGDRSIIVFRLQDHSVRALYVQCGLGWTKSAASSSSQSLRRPPDPAAPR